MWMEYGEADVVVVVVARRCDGKSWSEGKEVGKFGTRTQTWKLLAVVCYPRGVVVCTLGLLAAQNIGYYGGVCVIAAHFAGLSAAYLLRPMSARARCRGAWRLAGIGDLLAARFFLGPETCLFRLSPSSLVVPSPPPPPSL